jgi:hypothetical protein
LVQTLIVGGLFYLAALAIFARVRTNGTPPPAPAPGRVVLAQCGGEKVVRRRKRLRHPRQVACLQWWGGLQPANARSRAYCFSAYRVAQ